jgi:replicative DNA helicase
LNENDWAKILGATSGELAGLRIHINDKPAPTLSYMRSVCRRFERDGGIGLIAVDYIQIMGVEKSARDQNRTQDVSGLARGLKDTAKLFHCPVIALSQLNRAVENREDKRPQLSDLRESGEIEAAADIVVFLYRHEYYLERKKPVQKPDQTTASYMDDYAKWEGELEACRTIAEAIVQKCRFGKAPSTAPLHFEGARTWFSNAARWDQGNDNRAPLARPGSFGYGDN